MISRARWQASVNGQALLEAGRGCETCFCVDSMRNASGFATTTCSPQFLQRRLARDQPERITQLHATASRWFAEHNLLREAVDHAMAAGDEERAMELVETARH